MMKKTCVFLCLFGVLFLLSMEPVFSEAVLVSHPGFNAEAISGSDVKDVFLGKKTTLNGQAVIPVLLKSGTTFETFIQKYINKTLAQFNNYWKQQIFSGTAKAPKTFDKEEDVVQFLVSNAGTIACISSESFEANKDKIKKITLN